jgi:hypothetical protein
MCKSKEENKEESSSSMEKSLNLSLIFFPEMAPNTPYSYAISKVLGKPIATIDYIETNDSQIIFRNGFDTIIFDSIKFDSIKFDTIYSTFLNMEIKYSIDIINDSITIISKKWGNYKKHRDKLTDEQYLEIKKMISKLTRKYDKSENFALDVWGCVLKIDNQIYFQNNFFQNKPPPPVILNRYPNDIKLVTPQEIKFLIDYIVGLSPFPIDLDGFL